MICTYEAFRLKLCTNFSLSTLPQKVGCATWKFQSVRAEQASHARTPTARGCGRRTSTLKWYLFHLPASVRSQKGFFSADLLIVIEHTTAASGLHNSGLRSKRKSRVMVPTWLISSLSNFINSFN